MGRGHSGNPGECAVSFAEYAPNTRVRLLYGATCICCAHFIGKGTCEAFPGGIPHAVLTGEHDHRREHYRGDHGLLWESGLREVAPA
jgi:hypothetical protein